MRARRRARCRGGEEPKIIRAGNAATTTGARRPLALPGGRRSPAAAASSSSSAGGSSDRSSDRSSSSGGDGARSPAVPGFSWRPAGSAPRRHPGSPPPRPWPAAPPVLSPTRTPHSRGASSRSSSRRVDGSRSAFPPPHTHTHAAASAPLPARHRTPSSPGLWLSSAGRLAPPARLGSFRRRRRLWRSPRGRSLSPDGTNPRPGSGGRGHSAGGGCWASAEPGCGHAQARRSLPTPSAPGGARAGFGRILFENPRRWLHCSLLNGAARARSCCFAAAGMAQMGTTNLSRKRTCL